jgi:hypothetical protein
LPLFANPNGELSSLCRRWDIKVPELLHYDPESHVLILADLGELDTLTDLLTPLTPVRTEAFEDPQHYRDLGTRLGGFLAELHSLNTLELLGHKRSAYFDNPGVKDSFYDYIIALIRRHMEDFNIPDAAELCRRIDEEHIRPEEAWEQSFMIGDLWTGSILLDWPKVCVIDWELAGIGRGLSTDMAIFLAQLQLHLLASPVGNSAQPALRNLIRSTVGEYRRQTLKSHMREVRNRVENVDNVAFAKLSVEDLTVIRSAFIVHGRKMINNAVERDWHCGCCKDKRKIKRDCKLVVKMVDRGVWYLRRAASDLANFVQNSNWSKVMEEEERVILGMFLDC